MGRDAACFLAWVVLLGLLLHFGRGLGWMFEGRIGQATGFAMGLLAVGALALVYRLWHGLPRARRSRAGAVLLLATMGMALLAWAQPLLIERTHLILYGILGLLAWRLCGHLAAGSTRAAWALGLAVLVGVADEVVQHYHPQRVGDLYDVLTNGASAALLIASAWALSPQPE